jgi:predicted CXXCH cytochrome family protein
VQRSFSNFPVKTPVWLTVGALACLGVAGLFLSSCASVERTAVSPLTIEGATFVGNSQCVDCHTNISRQFPSSPHGRFHKDDVKWASNTGCESCHGPGSKHVAVGGGRGRFIINPGKDATSCFQCHLEVHAEMNLPSHHPVIENRMNCVQCHDPHGHDIHKPSGGLAMARLNQSCGECHREQARTFVYEHEAMREGCTTCHNPHGSINRKMLVEADNNLCLKCHAQIQAAPGQVVLGKLDHSEFVRGRSCWAAGCHSAVHGSNINPKLQY